MLFKAFLLRCGTHGVAVIHMQNQRLFFLPDYPILGAVTGHEIDGDRRVFSFCHDSVYDFRDLVMSL